MSVASSHITKWLSRFKTRRSDSGTYFLHLSSVECNSKLSLAFVLAVMPIILYLLLTLDNAHRIPTRKEKGSVHSS